MADERQHTGSTGQVQRIWTRTRSMDSARSSIRTPIAGVSNFLTEQVNYSVYHSIVILIVVCMSLYNLSVQSGDQQLWRDLLLFTFGLVIPTPQSKTKDK